MTASVFVLFNEVTTYLHIEVIHADDHLDFRLLNVACELDQDENIPANWEFHEILFLAIENISPCLFYRHEFLSSDFID